MRVCVSVSVCMSVGECVFVCVCVWLGVYKKAVYTRFFYKKVKMRLINKKFLKKLVILLIKSF